MKNMKRNFNFLTTKYIYKTLKLLSRPTYYASTHKFTEKKKSLFEFEKIEK